MSSVTTMNPRVAAVRNEGKAAYERRIRGAVVRLLANPDFRLYASHLVWGRFALESQANGEVQVQRRNAGAIVLAELKALDPAGYVALVVEHARVVADELEVELPNTQEEAPDA